MGPEHTLDLSCGDAVVIVTRAATLRVDCHRMDGDWSLLLQYRTDSQPPAARGNIGQPPPLGEQPSKAATLSAGGMPHAGRRHASTTLAPNLVNGRPGRYGDIRQADGVLFEPAKGVFGQMVPQGLLTARETAKALRISEKTLYTLTKSGEIGAIRFGRAVRYDPAALAEWIGRHSRKTRP